MGGVFRDNILTTIGAKTDENSLKHEPAKNKQKPRPTSHFSR